VSNQPNRPIVTIIWEPGSQGILTSILSDKITFGPREGAVAYRIYVNTKHPVAVGLKESGDQKLALAVLATELAIYIGQNEPEDGVRMAGGDLSIEQRPEGQPISSAGSSIITQYSLHDWWPDVLAGRPFYDEL